METKPTEVCQLETEPTEAQFKKKNGQKIIVKKSKFDRQTIKWLKNLGLRYKSNYIECWKVRQTTKTAKKTTKMKNKRHFHTSSEKKRIEPQIFGTSKQGFTAVLKALFEV